MQQAIQEFGKKNPYKIFEYIKTFEDFIEVNVAYLQGRLTATPYNHGPISEETVPLLGDLVKINSMGFCSIEGQPSQCEYGEYAPKTQLYVDVEQKSYIIGILQRQYLNDFIKFFQNKKNFYYIIGDSNGLIRNTLPELPYNVTRERGSKNKNDLKKLEWVYFTNIFKESVEHAEQIFFLNSKIVNETVSIVLCSSQYCKFSVEKILLKFLKNIEKKKNFVESFNNI